MLFANRARRPRLIGRSFKQDQTLKVLVALVATPSMQRPPPLSASRPARLGHRTAAIVAAIAKRRHAGKVAYQNSLTR